MIKVDIVKRVAQRLGMKDKDALAVVDSIIDSVKDVICENGRLEVRDFGVFQVKERKARVGRNPRNKEEYPIPPRKVVTFKLGKELKDFAVDEPGGEESLSPASGSQESKSSAPEHETRFPDISPAPQADDADGPAKQQEETFTVNWLRRENE